MGVYAFRKAFLWVAGCGAYATFMIGYLLLLTLVLPSVFVYEPNWIVVGNYAEYTTERGYMSNTHENGTYSWRIISTYTDDNGDLIARINETEIVEGEEDWTILDINVKDGLNESTAPLWFTRYYNDYLIDLSDFNLGTETFGGVCLEEVTVNDESRPSVRLARYHPSYGLVNSYWFDRETGLLLKYASWFKGIQDEKVLNSTNIVNGSHNNKAVTDLFFVAPLFVVPVVGVASGLLVIRQKRYVFSRKFWFLFVLFNGSILAFVWNFPFRAPLRLLQHSYSLVGGAYLMMLNTLFWFGVLLVAVFLVDHFVFPRILKNGAGKTGTPEEL